MTASFAHYAEPAEYETLEGANLIVGFGFRTDRDDVIALEHDGPAFLTVAQAQQVVNHLTDCIEIARAGGAA